MRLRSRFSQFFPRGICIGLRRRHHFGFGTIIEPADILDPHLGENTVPFLHLIDHPSECKQDFLGVGNYGSHQMGKIVVNLHLHDLGINHDEAEGLRSVTKDQTGDDRIDTDTLAASRGSSHQQMGHRSQIGDDRMTVDVLAQRQGQRCLG